MAHPIRSRRVTIAAGVLSVALVAPLVVAPESTTPFVSVAQAQTSDAFNERYTTSNFWEVDEAVVEGLELEPGTTVAQTTNTIWSWQFRNEDGKLIIGRPRSGFGAGDKDIRVKVTPATGSAYTTTLKLTVVDAEPEAVDKDKFNESYTTANFWGVGEAVIEGLELDPETKVSPTTSTVFNWNFRNDDGTLTLIRPSNPGSFKAGEQEINVSVSEPNGVKYTTTLKVNVVDQAPESVEKPKLEQRYDTANFWNVNEAAIEGLELDPETKISTTANAIWNWTLRNDGGKLTLVRPTSSASYSTGEKDINVAVAEANGLNYTATLKVNVVEQAPEPVEQPKLEQRYPTANFWNANEAVVEDLELEPGTTIAPRANTAFNWGFRNDDGKLTLIRPSSAAAFNTGDQDIPVTVTEENGLNYPATLKVKVLDQRTAKEWEEQLQKTYDMDFEKSAAPKPLTEITLPEGVELSKKEIIHPSGWGVSVENGVVNVKPAATFIEGFFELPVTVNDGTDTFEAKLRINARNPQSSATDVAGGVAGTLGKLLGGLLGVPNLGNLLGGLLGGGGSGDGSGDGSGGGSGRLINIVVTNNANNNGSPNVNVVVTGNANNNGSNNGSNNSVVITDNANPRDNFSNNGNPVITNNGNPVITGNANNNGSNNGSNNTVTDNGNPSVIITDNANPRDNFSNNGSNNSAVVTGNANPVITGNANNNGSNNSAIVTGNANPTVDIRDNGSNNSAIVTGNANPSVIVTGNANPQIGGGLGSALGGSSKRGEQGGEGGQDAGKGGSSNGGSSGNGSSIGADVETTGGLSDPRCIASLAGLGVPLLLAIPVALAQSVGAPGASGLAPQLQRTLEDAARNFGVQPTDLTAVAGGVIGAILTVAAIGAATTCIPKVRNVGVEIRGPQKPGLSTAALPAVEPKAV